MTMAVRRRFSSDVKVSVDLGILEKGDGVNGTSFTGVENSSTASDYGSRGHWWSLLGGDSSTKDDDGDRKLWDVWFSVLAFWSKFFETCRKVPSIPLGAFLFFVALCGGAVAAVVWSYQREQDDRKDAALAVATSLASALSAQFDLVLLPMFALAVDASTDPVLFRAPEIILAWPVDTSEDPPTYRIPQTNNETEALIERFSKVASDLRSLLSSSSAIVSLQMGPGGVVSLIHPLNDVDATAIGFDVLLAPSRLPDASRAIRSQRLALTGPVTLIQGGEMIVGRLPIFVHKDSGQGLDTRDIPLIGEEVKKDHLFWGFSVTLIDFQKLLQETRFESELANHQMRFNLTRIDRTLGEDGVTIQETLKIIASSAPIGGKAPDDPANEVRGVEVEVEFHGERMTLGVTCARSCEPSWLWWALVLAVVGSVVVAGMGLAVQVTRAQHSLLLHKMLPRKAIKKINRGQQVIDEFETVSIFFSDIVGFTNLAGTMHPIDVMRMLNDLYQAFDRLVEQHGVYKVETIGDAYMVVSGAPDPTPGPETAFRVATFALACLDAVATLETASGHRIQIRCGIHSGPVVAGVVGTAMPRYCFFGDTVNTASRMESTSTVGRLQVSASTCGLLQSWIDASPGRAAQSRFRIEPRQGQHGGAHGVEVKGKGRMLTYWITRQTDHEPQPEAAHASAPAALASAGPASGNDRSRPSASERLETQPEDAGPGVSPLAGGTTVTVPPGPGNAASLVQHQDQDSREGLSDPKSEPKAVDGQSDMRQGSAAHGTLASGVFTPRE